MPRKSHLRIAVVGNLTLDTISRVHSLPKMNDVAIIQETRQFYGGWAGNIAVLLQRLGVQTSLFAVGGSDFQDSGYEAHLAQIGVDIQNISIIPGKKTARFILFRDHNENSNAYFFPNVEKEHYDKVLDNSLLFSNYDMICLAKFGSEEETNQFLLKASEQSHVKLVVALGHILYQGSVDLLKKIVLSAKYIFMNDKEAISFLDKLDLQQHLQATFSIPAARLEAVVVTQADMGSNIYTSDL
ncbi:MAG: hypothetical protein IH859_09955, partial [Chloroflexi bacterium]|nr:hypothetical protein [Chloroflexota bacterium]